MIPELETLYQQAIQAENLTRWLRDKNMIREYEDSARFVQEDQAFLQSVLREENLDVFQRYIDNKKYQTDAECRTVFTEGFSIGLRLGSLCAWR